MNYTITFQERAKLAMEQFADQQPVTLGITREQALKLKTKSKSENKMQRR